MNQNQCYTDANCGDSHSGLIYKASCHRKSIGFETWLVPGEARELWQAEQMQHALKAPDCTQMRTVVLEEFIGTILSTFWGFFFYVYKYTLHSKQQISERNYGSDEMNHRLSKDNCVILSLSQMKIEITDLCSNTKSCWKHVLTSWKQQLCRGAW